MADRNEYFPTDPARGEGFIGSVYCFSARARILATDLVVGRTVGLGLMPKGAIMISGSILATDMDTHSTPTLIFNIGDAALPSRLFPSLTIGQNNSASNTMSWPAIGYKYAADTEIIFKTNTAAATPADGVIYVNLLYTFHLVNSGYRQRFGG